MQLLASGPRLSLLLLARRARRDAREAAARRQADALRRPLARPRPCRGARRRRAGDPPAGPGQDGETVIDDKVQGKVVFSNKELDDLILLRSDGNPTYMLAVVVDDHDMGVTHIIRGDDHLTNAARQMQIYQALGWSVPVMAHIPLIHGPDGAKLSKRHGALGVDAYRAMGYLPAALRNYLVRLGWSQGDKRVLHDRGDDRRLRSVGDRPLAVALRLRQAREHERPFHARDARRRAARRSGSTPCPICPAARRSPPSSTSDEARAARRRAARPQGARENAGRAHRRRQVPVRQAAAGDGRQGRGDSRARRPGPHQGAAAGARGARRMERGFNRGCGARLCGASRARSSASSRSPCARR